MRVCMFLVTSMAPDGQKITMRVKLKFGTQQSKKGPFACWPIVKKAGALVPAFFSLAASMSMSRIVPEDEPPLPCSPWWDLTLRSY